MYSPKRSMLICHETAERIEKSAAPLVEGLENGRVEKRFGYGYGVAQVAIIGLIGDERCAYVKDLRREYPELDVRATGYCSIVIQAKGVDKTLPVSYVHRNFKTLFPNAKADTVFIFADLDGTVCGKPTAGPVLPGLDTSPELPAVLAWLEKGYCVIINTSNEMKTTLERLTRNGAIPNKYYDQVLIGACGGAVMTRLTPDGYVPIGAYWLMDDYEENALQIRKETPELPPNFNCLYYGDDPSSLGEDYPAFEFVGKERSRLISNRLFDELPPLLRGRNFKSIADADARRVPSPISLPEAFKAQLASGEIPVSPGSRVPTTRTPGKVLSIDFGGTEVRVVLYMVNEDGAFTVLKDNRAKFTANHKNGTANPFSLVTELLKGMELDGELYPVGISFSQPMMPIPDKPGGVAIAMSAKGWNLNHYVGVDLYETFQELFDANGFKNLRVRAINNDVASAHLAMPEADLTVVVGTGFAVSYVKDGRVYVVEAGEFRSPQADEIDLQILEGEPPYGKRCTEKMVSGRYAWRNNWMFNQANTLALTSEPYTEGIGKKLRAEGREEDPALGLKVLCERFQEDIVNKAALPEGLTSVWRNACVDWRVGSLCSLDGETWTAFARSPIAGKLHYQLLSYYESDLMEGFDPFVYSGNGISRLIETGDQLLVRRVERAGLHIGATLSVLAEGKDTVNIVADGTLIQRLAVMRNAADAALAPIKATWHLINDAPLKGAAMAALNARYVYSVDDPAVGCAGRFGGKSAQTHHMRRAVGEMFQGGFAVSVDANGVVLAEQLAAIPRHYGKGVTYAVRSSATVEDNEKSAFPGQFKSYLNVPAEGLLEAVRKVQQSVYRENVAAYCAQNGVELESVKMGVLIMPMVGKQQHVISGAIFTVSPTNGRDDLYISACKGWGEAEMAGTVTPETAVVSRDGQIIHVKPFGDEYLLDNETRLNLAGAAKKIEAAMRANSPNVRYADIEYVIDDGKIVIVQARPETTAGVKQGAYRTLAAGSKYNVIADAGFAASRGVASGRAVYCANLEDAKQIGADDILLCDETTSTWEAFMRKCRAIVTTHGGANSHTAVCAREMGIPAIVGLGEGSMAGLKRYEGASITVDATARKVYAGAVDERDLVYASGEPDYGHLDNADEEATFKSARAASQTFTGEQGENWIGKPMEATSPLLWEVHRRSHAFISGVIGVPLVKDMVKDGVYYVRYADVQGFRERLREMTVPKLAQLLQSWDTAMEDYVAFSENIDGSDDALNKWFEMFVKVNGWMNLSYPLYMVCAGHFEQALAERNTKEPYFTRAHHSVPPHTPLNWAQFAVFDYIKLLKDESPTDAAILRYAMRYRFLPSYSIEFDSQPPVEELRIKLKNDRNNIPTFRAPEVEEFFVNDDAFQAIHRNMQTAERLKESAHHMKLYAQRCVIAKYGSQKLKEWRF